MSKWKKNYEVYIEKENQESDREMKLYLWETGKTEI